MSWNIFFTFCNWCQWSIKNWRFEERFNKTLKNNTIRCKKLAIIVLGRKNVAWRFFRRKQGSMSAEMLLLLLMLCRMPLLLHFGTCAYLFSPEEGSCYVFSTQNNCCQFLASDGVIFQSVIKPLCNYLQNILFLFLIVSYILIVIFN